MDGETLKLYRHDSLDPALNLALEEALAVAGEACFLLWRNRPSVIIGRNQDAAAEVDLAEARRSDIPVIRRMSGGGAVYHDTGNVNLSWISGDDTPIWAPLRAMFAELGLNPEFVAPNDLLLDGRKISGAAEYRSGNCRLRHATLLCRIDMHMPERLLTPSTEKLAKHAVPSVRARIVNLADCVPPPLTSADFPALAERSAAQYFGAAFGDVPAELWRTAKRIAEQKYQLEAWNRYGKLV